MAVKQKPKENDISEELTTGAFTSINDYKQSQLRTMIRTALQKPSRALENRCTPFENSKKLPRVKWHNRKKLKDNVSCNLPKTIPVLDTGEKEQTVTAGSTHIATYKQPSVNDDSELYAMWWDFNGDRSTLMKTVSINISAKEKADRIRDTRASQESKSRIKNVKALGITPRNHKHGPKVIGKAIHHANPEFGSVIANNPEYKEELYERFLVTKSIKDLASLSMEKNYPQYIPEPSVVSDIDNLIHNLEVIVEEDTQAEFVGSVTTVHPLQSFDITASLPSATPIPTLVEDEAQYEQDQWSDHATPAERMYTKRFEPWANDEEIQYCLALNKQYAEPWKGFFPMSQLGNDNWYTEEGVEYRSWLIKHKSSIHLRERVELSKLRVNPEHVMSLGLTVHPMYHVGVRTFLLHNKSNEYRNRAQEELGNISQRSSGEWFRYTTQLMASKEKANADVVIDTTKVIERAEKEQLVDKIVDDAIHSKKSESQLGFLQWNYMVASQYVVGTTPKITTVSKTSLSPMTDAIFNKWEGERKGAEVVSLKDVREKRAANLSTFLNGFNFDISSLTEEEKEGARKVVEALTKALG